MTQTTTASNPGSTTPASVFPTPAVPSLYTVGTGQLGTAASPSSLSGVLTPDQINALIGSVVTESGVAANAAAQSTAEGIIATGDTAEAGAYDVAQSIATGNAQLATANGTLQQYQQMRGVYQTLGSQKADISAAGFANSGTALSLARSSLQQGLLENQVIGQNAALQAGGYYQQAAASGAEATAATTASTAATATATADASQGTLAKALAQTESGLINSGTTASGASISTTPLGELANVVSSGNAPAIQTTPGVGLNGTPTTSVGYTPTSTTNPLTGATTTTAAPPANAGNPTAPPGSPGSVSVPAFQNIPGGI